MFDDNLTVRKLISSCHVCDVTWLPLCQHPNPIGETMRSGWCGVLFGKSRIQVVASEKGPRLPPCQKQILVHQIRRVNSTIDNLRLFFQVPPQLRMFYVCSLRLMHSFPFIRRVTNKLVPSLSHKNIINTCLCNERSHSNAIKIPWISRTSLPQL